MRLTRRRLKERHSEEYEIIRRKVELDLYPQVQEEWNAAHAPVVGLDEEGQPIR